MQNNLTSLTTDRIVEIRLAETSENTEETVAISASRFKAQTDVNLIKTSSM